MVNDPKDTSTPIDESELIEIFASIDPTQMRMARDLLEGSGIECFVFDRENSRMLGSNPAFPIRMMVHRDVAADATQRLKDLGFAE
jgi:Putative prokaryotic signal transducing protein